MKRTLIAIVVLASSVAFANDPSKKKDQQTGQMGQQPGQQTGQTPPSQTQPSPSDTGSMGNGEAGSMGNGSMTMPKPQFSRSMIQDWPAEAQKAAQDMVAKYGSPKEMTSSMLVWENAGPFKKTRVLKEAVDHQFPVPHKEVIEQVIDYKVPADKLDDLVQFNGSLTFDRTKGELSVRSDSEANNIAILNAADQLVKNKMSVSKARDSLAKAIQQQQQAGGAQGQEPKLQIATMTQPTEDPDRPAPGMGQ